MKVAYVGPLQRLKVVGPPATIHVGDPVKVFVVVEHDDPGGLGRGSDDKIDRLRSPVQASFGQ